MAEERVQRRLAAILAVDVVGYNRIDSWESMAALSHRTDPFCETRSFQATDLTRD